MADNLKTWNALADIDPKFTKPITGKPYKGTSPNPHYIVKMLTDHFGPVGQGWGVRVVAEGFQPLGEEVIHWCRVEMWHTKRENTFEAYGQTKALMKTRNGMMADEDAPKKSFTDAMTKAASYVGAGANIFLGRYDDSKYVEQVNREFRQAENKAERDPKAVADSLISLVNKAQTGGNLDAILGSPKFDAAWQWLAEEHEDHSNRVREAVDRARQKVKEAA